MGNLSEKLSESNPTEVNLLLPTQPDQLPLESEECLLEIKHPHQVSKAFFNGERTKVITCCFDEGVRIFSVKTGKLLKHLENCHKDWIRDIAVTQDFKKAVTCGDDRAVNLWNLESGNLIKGHSSVHKELVTSIHFNKSETKILSTSSDGNAKVWDPITGIEDFTLVRNNLGSCRFGIFSHRDDYIFTSYANARVVIWSRDTGLALHDLIHSGTNMYPIFSLQVSSDDQQVFTCCSGDQSIKIWSVSSGKLLRTVRFINRTKDPEIVQKSGPSFFAMNENGAYLLDANHCNYKHQNTILRLWDLHQDRCLKSLYGHHLQILSVSISKNLLISTSADKTCRIWNVEVYAREKLMLLLCWRARIPDSVWYKENLPLDVFKLIIKESNLWN